jgi:sugar transferase (PEP-CTERM/EpsH1 system associated)
VRILFIAHRFPFPPTFGSRVRAFNVIRHLGKAHALTVLSPVRSAAEAREAEGLAPYCASFETFRVRNWVQAAKIAASLPTSRTASEAFFHSAPMQRRIKSLLASRRFDFVFAHCSAVGRYFENIERPPGLIDYCDVDSRKWRDYARNRRWPFSAGYWWEAVRLEAAERRLARSFEGVTVATRGEVAALSTLGITRNVDWFPNGVDLDYFAPSAQPYDPDLITFVGRMDYFPNVQCMAGFCAQVMPMLRLRRPGLRLQIVGAAPAREVRQLARLPGVTVTGAVADVRPYVMRSALTVAPLRIALGTQNKILESMAMGVPVVSSAVAAAGVDADPGEHLLTATTPDDYCDAILRILGDPAERTRLAQAGRARMLSNHDWGSSMKRLDAIIERCLVSRTAPRHAGDPRVGGEAAVNQR